MADTTIGQLGEWGQSLWLDNISRSMIRTGKLDVMIENGLRGITSNPTIFEKAISGSSDYDDAIESLYKAGKSTFEIYDDLTVRDIQDAADMFRPMYEKLNRTDGFVSLEINPQLAYNTEETIEEGLRLFRKVDRPNVLLKVPSTDEGFGAIQALLAEGVNVNITLIFSMDQYIRTAKAFLNGMSERLKKTDDLSKMYSVASVFVSRVDTAVDKMLDEAIKAAADQGVAKELQSLMGKAAVANAHLIYKKSLEICSSEEFKRLQGHGAHVQRVLWGSTGTKNPDYSDIKYVTELIAKNTVNTLPENTIEAFLDHGVAKEALTADAEASERIIGRLRHFGVDVDRVCVQLLEDGAAAFTASFESLLKTLESKARQTSAES